QMVLKLAGAGENRSNILTVQKTILGIRGVDAVTVLPVVGLETNSRPFVHQLLDFKRVMRSSLRSEIEIARLAEKLRWARELRVLPKGQRDFCVRQNRSRKTRPRHPDVLPGEAQSFV